MAEDNANQPSGPAPAPAAQPARNIVQVAAEPGASKPADISNSEWRRARMAAGQMVIIRSHFKSIYLIPMALISLACGILGSFIKDRATAISPEELANITDREATLGMVWVVAFCFYMSIFIFEWSRAWTFGTLMSVAAVVLLGFAVDSPDFPVWDKVAGAFKSLQFGFTKTTFFFFAAFFVVCAGISFVKTRLNYVVVESNEIQIYRNALFGDRERVSMLNPRIEVRVPDMVEYFHPFYRAGQILIHAPDRSIVLDNVLQIRRIERVTDRLGSSLQVTVAQG